MKSIIIFGLYYLLIGLSLGMATFLMYHKINGWGWLIFMSFILATSGLKVDSQESQEGKGECKSHLNEPNLK